MKNSYETPPNAACSFILISFIFCKYMEYQYIIVRYLNQNRFFDIQTKIE